MPVRSCRVTIRDMDGVEHTVQVTASTLDEAVALVLKSVATVFQTDADWQRTFLRLSKLAGVKFHAHERRVPARSPRFADLAPLARPSYLMRDSAQAMPRHDSYSRTRRSLQSRILA